MSIEEYYHENYICKAADSPCIGCNPGACESRVKRAVPLSEDFPKDKAKFVLEIEDSSIKFGKVGHNYSEFSIDRETYVKLSNKPMSKLTAMELIILASCKAKGYGHSSI